VGYHTTLEIQTNQAVAIPALVPKASWIQVYIPPLLGHPVPSSAEMSPTGMRKRMAPMRMKKREDSPSSALMGQLRTLRIEDTNMPIRRMMLRDFFSMVGANCIGDGGFCQGEHIGEEEAPGLANIGENKKTSNDNFSSRKTCVFFFEGESCWLKKGGHYAFSN